MSVSIRLTELRHRQLNYWSRNSFICKFGEFKLRRGFGFPYCGRFFQIPIVIGFAQQGRDPPQQGRFSGEYAAAPPSAVKYSTDDPSAAWLRAARLICLICKSQTRRFCGVAGERLKILWMDFQNRCQNLQLLAVSPTFTRMTTL